MSDTVTRDDSGAHQRRLGPYQLLEPLPAYGMIQPYVARRVGEVDLLLVKRLLLELTGNVSARARFARQARIARHLRHPNLVPAFDAGEDDDVFYLATEWVRGVSLHALQQRLMDLGRVAPLDVFAAIALPVLDGVGYAHAATGQDGLPLQIVHRDLAPRSVLLSFLGEVKINDFGVARARVDDFKTLPGVAVGSVPYMSPEQVRGQPLDRRSDLYTIGVVFYELLAGRRVVPDGELLPMARMVVEEEPTPLAARRPDLDPRLVQAVQRALAKDPQERWPDAGAFRDALAAALPAPEDGARRLSALVRRLLPEREAETLALVNQIRETGEVMQARLRSQIGSDGAVAPAELDARPQRELATQVVRRRAEEDAEPPEPSVMTMPGAPVPEAPAEPVVSSPGLAQGPVAGRRARSGVLIGAAVVALGLTGAAAWVTLGSTDAEPVAQAPARAPRPAAGASPSAAPKPPQPARPEARPAAAPPAPAARRRSSPPAQAPEPPPAAEPLVEAPAPAPTPAPRYEQLQAQLRAVRASPKDVLAFERLHAAIARAAEDLPAAQARAVRADLGAAERAYDVELLARALKKLAR